MDNNQINYFLGFFVNIIIILIMVWKKGVKINNVYVLLAAIVLSWVGTLFLGLGWLINKFPYLKYGLTGDVEEYRAWKKRREK